MCVCVCVHTLAREHTRTCGNAARKHQVYTHAFVCNTQRSALLCSDASRRFPAHQQRRQRWLRQRWLLLRARPGPHAICRYLPRVRATQRVYLNALATYTYDRLILHMLRPSHTRAACVCVAGLTCFVAIVPKCAEHNGSIADRSHLYHTANEMKQYVSANNYCKGIRPSTAV